LGLQRRMPLAVAVAVAVLLSTLGAIVVAVPGRGGSGPGVPGGPALGGAPAGGPNPAPGLGDPATSAPPAVATVAPGYTPGVGTELLGALAPSANLSAVVGLPSSDPAGLDAFVTAASVPGTPAYRHFLDAAEADARFGAAPAEVRGAEAYFDRFGLTSQVRSDGLLLAVSGPASDVARAFSTTFDLYATSTGREFASHPTAARLPTSLGATGVYGLGNVTPFVPGALPDPASSIVPAVGCIQLPDGLSPCDIDAAYNLSALVGSGVNGTGTTIGVVDAYSSEESQTQLSSDLATFSGETGIPVGRVHYLYPVPTAVDLNTSSANDVWSVEEALDLEWARASAPGAAIDMTFSPNSGVGLYEAVDALVAADAVNVISLSWGEPDVGVYNAWDTPCSVACNATSDGSYAVLGPVLELGAAEGISVLAASGDCGSADGTSGLSTNFPASDPYVTGVGGTALDVSPSGSWLSETAWSGNATGGAPPGCSNQGGSGGGFSPLPRPWWQIDISDPTGGRGVPDVALDAATPVGVVVDGGSTGVRGTSVGTPIWAGLAAIADQSNGGDLGLLDPALYRILDSLEYNQAFHPITSGQNGAYSAAAGWNPVTGIGSPIANVLVSELVQGVATDNGQFAAFLYAAPRIGPAPLDVSFALANSGPPGFGAYGIYFGDGTSDLFPRTTGPTHVYTTPGVYYAQAFFVDPYGNGSIVSAPIVISVGQAPISVSLSVSDAAPSIGAPVTFTATASGGIAPYSYDFFFGDGASTLPGPAASVPYTYPIRGGFCAEVIANDSSTPARGAASLRLAITVSGFAAPSCGNAAEPLTLTPTSPDLQLDAPADVLTPLFVTSGGVEGGRTVTDSVVERSTDPYTIACGCLIFRAPGRYVVTEWVNDTVNDEAVASTNVTVVPSLDATFSASTLAGPVPLTVDFSASVTGGLDARASASAWTFGDGSNATGASVSVTYSSPGEYLALGRISDAGEGNASEAFLIDAEVGVASPLGIDGTISPAQDLLAGTAVTFSANLVGPIPGGGPAGPTEWQLGLGRSAWQPAGTSIAETYDAPLPSPADDALHGNVSVASNTLVPLRTVPFALGSFYSETTSGTVRAADALTANVTVGPTVGESPIVVSGEVTGSAPSSLECDWTASGSSGAAGCSAGFSLTATGSPTPYTVATQVSDSFGDVATFLSAVVVEPALDLVAGPSTVDGTAPLTVSFTAEISGGSGPPYSFLWTFPNGTTVSNENVSVVFGGAGSYLVHLSVTDSVGDAATDSWTIQVHGPPSTLPAAFLLLASAAVGAGVAVAVAIRSRGRPPPAG
jgi:kumamolisin